MAYSRPILDRLSSRLGEAPKRIQILAGPRQVGKTTLVRQYLATRPPTSGMYVAADINEPPTLSSNVVREWRSSTTPSDRFDDVWLLERWQAAEKAAIVWRSSNHPLAALLPFVFVLDEIQKVPRWSDRVKGLWDRQMAFPSPMQVLLLGSAPLLMQKGLNESLAGRFEVMPITHWAFEEMNDAFGFTLDQYLYFGAYPGSAGYVQDETRWRDYVLRSLIEPNIERDVLMMTRVDKPALLKQLFDLGCVYSGQIVSLDKTLVQLSDAGNVTTLARYLDLLAQAGLLAGLHKHSAQALRRRQSPPKFQVLNNALMSAKGHHRFNEARTDRSHWGRLVESAVGAHLVNSAETDTRIHYWREGGLEVDFVIEHRGRLAAIEVKSGKVGLAQPGLAEFSRRQSACVTWVVGADALSVGEFLRYPAAHWVG